MNFDERLDDLYGEMVKWRRYLHQHPELSFREERTSAFVADRLRAMGLDVRERFGDGYGVVADCKGAGEGPVVALRADIDALPIQDEKDCPYASKVEGVMHACGHDGHTAALLAVAKAASESRQRLRGTIRFIFQPAEEVTPGGAKGLVDAGVLHGVDAIYGGHLWTPFSVGTLFSKPGPIMAAPDEFQLVIKGRGGHGGLPHHTVDSVVVASHLVVNLQTVVSRTVNPVEPAVVTVGSFHAGSGFNVIADSASLAGTVRTFDREARLAIKRNIERIVRDTCSMFGADYSLDYILGYPPVINDNKEYERFERIAASLTGQANVRLDAPLMAGEDFSYYLQQIPGCFVLVGAGNPDTGAVYPHHHPRFDIDERAMLLLAKVLARLALDRLSQESKP